MHGAKERGQRTNKEEEEICIYIERKRERARTRCTIPYHTIPCLSVVNTAIARRASCHADMHTMPSGHVPGLRNPPLALARNPVQMRISPKKSAIFIATKKNQMVLAKDTNIKKGKPRLGKTKILKSVQ